MIRQTATNLIITGYTGGQDAWVIESRQQSVELRQCTALPPLPGTVTKLIITDSKMEIDGTLLPRLKALTCISSQVEMTGRMPGEVSLGNSKWKTDARSDRPYSLRMDGHSILLNSSGWEGALIRELHLFFDDESVTAGTISQLVKNGVVELPRCETFYLPLGWSAPVSHNPVVVVDREQPCLPKGVGCLLLVEEGVYITQAPDLRCVLIMDKCIEHYQDYYHDKSKSRLIHGPEGDGSVHYRGTTYYSEELPSTRPNLNSAQLMALRRQLECFTTK